MSKEDVFEFSPTAVELHGEPTFKEWEANIKRIGMVSRSEQFWVGDLLLIADERFEDEANQIIPDLPYEVQSIANMKSVAKRVTAERRRSDLTWAHHSVVAKLDADDQVRWLKRAFDKKMSAATLRSAIKLKMQKASEKDDDDGTEGRYRVIVAEVTREMELDHLESIKIPAEQNSVIYVIVPAERARDAILLLECWNFAFASTAVIDHGKGERNFWFKNQHSLVFVGTRGNAQSPPNERLAPSVLKVRAAKGGGIGDEFYEAIFDSFPSDRTKRLELFGTEARDGWDNMTPKEEEAAAEE